MSENKNAVSAKEAPPFKLHAGKTSPNKFISHLLGLDQELAPVGKAKSNSFAPSLSGLKLSDALQGIKLTPNFMFLLLFLGFFAWLFVIYWIRHNEPLADSVLGKPKVSPHAAAADRALVAGIKKSFPVQTSATTGEIYVPGVAQHASSQQAADAPQHGQQYMHYPAQHAYAATQYQNQLSTHPMYGSSQPAQGAYYQQGYGAPTNHAGGSSHVVMPSQAVAGASSVLVPMHSGQMVLPSTHGQAYHVSNGNYMVGVQTESGTKVKTIVSR